MVDLSNPFSILEHCYVIEPISSRSLSKNLIVAMNSSPQSVVLEADTNLSLPQVLPQPLAQDLPSESPLPNQISPLEVDLLFQTYR